MCKTKVGGRLSTNSRTSRNDGISIAKSNREHKIIVGIGWRVVVITSTLNCMHMQAVVHVMQSCHENFSIATATDHHITIGWNAIAKATADF